MWRDRNGNIAGRLQDGGLFENYGAETALEILRAAKIVLKDRFKPRVILISSDPKLPEKLAESPLKKPMALGYEFATLVTYMNTRVGRGAEAASRLQEWVEENGRKGKWAYFRMCPPADNGRGGKNANPPLGWALSESAKQVIEGYLLDEKVFAQGSCPSDNRSELNKVRRWLSPATPQG